MRTLAFLPLRIRLSWLTSGPGRGQMEIMNAKYVQLADEIARAAHDGQTDKSGVPYIAHPRSVAERVRPASDANVAAALLHDVVEDTGESLDTLRAKGIPDNVVAAVELLTRRADVSSDDYYRAIRADPIALAVKVADIADNTDPTRVARLDAATRTRLREKYVGALRKLGRDDLADELMARD